MPAPSLTQDDRARLLPALGETGWQAVPKAGRRRSEEHTS